MERKEARKAARAAAKREALLYELADDLRGRELHSTEELLFLDKPGRCPMHPGYGNPERVLPLTERLALAFPGEQLRTVNRLDKDTTGVVVLARSEEAARRLGDAFAKNTSDAIEQARKEAVEEVVDEASTEAVDEAGQAADAASAEGEEAAAREVDEDGEDWDGVPEGLTKEYLAFLNGPLDADIPDSDTVRNYIGLVGAPGHEVMRMREDPAPGTREAVTSYRVLARFPLGSVVLFVPETGRKHQVRAFAANVLRTPVMGDRKFNRESRAKRFGLCLHCSRLTVEGTTVVAALPKDWVPWGEERGISAAQLQKAVAGYYEGLIAEGAVGYFENFVVNAKGVAVTPKPFAFTVTQRAAQDSAAKWQPSASESETVEAEAAEGEAETVAADAAEAEESHSETAEVVDASAEAADAALKQKGRGRKRRLFSK
ncbi:pseudouridine synthase [Hyaloraphidium curvatum]|nr:pseudouridine synthase [Hyaloraphidium curvatum]